MRPRMSLAAQGALRLAARRDAGLAEPGLLQLGSVQRVRAEEIVGHEWAAWYALSPGERLLASAKLWETYLALGGSLEPEPDTQSPFFDADEWRENSPHGRAGVHILRRGGI